MDFEEVLATVDDEGNFDAGEISTRPEDMTGASRLRQHDNLQKQIRAFEKLTRHAVNKISGDALYRMLQTLTRGVPNMRGARITHKPLLPNNNRIVSFKQLRHLVATLDETKRKGIQKEEVDHVIRYFRNLFKDLQFLKKLKTYFDERIYCCLYEYFYDPTDLDLLIYSSDNDDANDDETDDFVDSGHSSSMRSDADESPIKTASYYDKYSRAKKNSPSSGAAAAAASASLGSETTVEGPPNKIQEKQKLLFVVRKLNTVNRNWDAVLSEEEIDYRSFDEDSVHDLIQFKDVAHFEPVFRVVFDVFVKCHKSLELARTWWTLADIVYDTPLAGARTAQIEFDRKMKLLKSRIKKANDDIRKDEHVLLVYENDLTTLRKRENRVDSLDKNCTDLVDRKTRAQKDYNSVVKRREDLKIEIENTVQGTSRYNDLCMELRNIEVDMIEKYQHFKLLKYQFDILERDYHVELEVRPNFIRFTDHVQAKINDLTRNLTEKKLNRRDLEKSHELLRTNYEIMRDVITRYAVASSPERPLVDENESSPEPTPPAVADDEAIVDDVTEDTATDFEKPSFFITQAEASVLTAPPSDEEENEANDGDVDDENDDDEHVVRRKRIVQEKRNVFDHSKPLGQQDYFVPKAEKN
ncbi:uncharacterized protein LOC141911915 isoform X2 [Tubulanus polymorphus]|uniref:uncharacterized protein LOC141911915 isoform X2 n=1 Tax=Tubulanus polymorphus TaxID=672921 RepID=UPI003DA365A6